MKAFWIRKVTQKLNNQAKKQRKISKTPLSSTRSSNNLSGTADTSTSKRRKGMSCLNADDDDEFQGANKVCGYDNAFGNVQK